MSETHDRGATAAAPPMGSAVAFALAASLLAALTLAGLGHPLVWQDEGETVMFGQRVREFGYPRVHDGRNVVYGMGLPLADAVDEDDDAYIGSLWGQYYFAALGVALAEGVEDPWARTARLRMPFALAGLLGLALAFLAVSGSVPPGRGARLRAAAVYAVVLCSCTSLILHVREVRYYALVVLLIGACLCVHFRGGTGRARAALLQTVLLTLLFNVFYPAAVGVAAWLVLEGGLRVHRRNGGLGERISAEAPLALALLTALLIALPVAAYFEIVALSQLMSARWAFGPDVYLENIGFVLRYLLRFEFLAPALLAHGGLLALRGVAGRPAPDVAEPMEKAAALLRLCLCLGLIGARNPIYFERYFVPLSALLVLVVGLDAIALSRWLRAAWSEGPEIARRVAAATAGLLLLSLPVLVLIKSPELAGHLHQVAHPYRGPLDHVIPDLAARYPDPAALTIATNYEAEAYMYYLGSRVVGRFHDARPAARSAEAAVRADVIVPRGGQPKGLDTLEVFIEDGRFTRHVYPVEDLPYNNIPELDRGRVLAMTHRFRSSARADGSPLVAYMRVEARASAEADAADRAGSEPRAGD